MRAEVERRLDRPFVDVQRQLTEYFGRPWDDVEISISTSAHKQDTSEADVIVELVRKQEVAPPIHQKVRRRMIRWIGKSWRERQNPWERYKHRIPEPPSRRERESEDLDEWTPLRPEED